MDTRMRWLLVIISGIIVGLLFAGGLWLVLWIMGGVQGIY